MAIFQRLACPELNSQIFTNLLALGKCDTNNFLKPMPRALPPFSPQGPVPSLPLLSSLLSGHLARLSSAISSPLHIHGLPYTWIITNPIQPITSHQPLSCSNRSYALSYLRSGFNLHSHAQESSSPGPDLKHHFHRLLLPAICTCRGTTAFLNTFPDTGGPQETIHE